MDKEQIRAEIKDLSYRLQFHTEQADFHRGVAEKTLKMVKQHEGQLVDMQLAEQPKLRHGNYGIEGDENREPFVAFATNNSAIPGEIVIYHRTQAGKHSTKFLSYSRHAADCTIFGEIFDEIEELAKPLKKYRWEAEGYSYFAEIDRDGDLRLTCPALTDNRMIVNKVDLPAFILNLRRLNHTAEQEKNGKDNT